MYMSKVKSENWLAISREEKSVNLCFSLNCFFGVISDISESSCASVSAS